jgi:hypothetical protein
MPPWTKMLGDRTIGGKESLGLAWGLKPLHAPLPLTCRLVGVLRPVIEVAVLAMFYSRKNLTLGGSVALQLISDDHPWHVP